MPCLCAALFVLARQGLGYKREGRARFSLTLHPHPTTSIMSKRSRSPSPARQVVKRPRTESADFPVMSRFKLHQYQLACRLHFPQRYTPPRRAAEGEYHWKTPFHLWSLHLLSNEYLFKHKIRIAQVTRTENIWIEDPLWFKRNGAFRVRMVEYLHVTGLRKTPFLFYQRRLGALLDFPIKTQTTPDGGCIYNTNHHSWRCIPMAGSTVVRQSCFPVGLCHPTYFQSRVV